MRWPTPVPPKPGDRRTRVRFAWLPIDLDTGERVWLERVVVVEEYRDIPYEPWTHWFIVKASALERAS